MTKNKNGISTENNTANLITDYPIPENFDAVVENRLAKVRAMLVKKNKEYAPTGSSRFHNFYRASRMLGCSAEKSLLGMWSKHLVSVLDIIDNIEKCQYPSAPLLEEKITDTIAYAILLEGLIKEQVAKMG